MKIVQAEGRHYMIIGFIGCGNMAKAMIAGMLSKKLVPADAILVSDINKQTLQEMNKEYGIRIGETNQQVASEADMLILAVKPYHYPVVIKDIREYVSESTILITIAAGRTIEDTQRRFNRPIKIVRVMPNTPALVGEAMSTLTPNAYINDQDYDRVAFIFSSFGKVERVAEHQMDAVIAVSGSSPAYAFMMIEAMADAAVLQGMARDQAYRMASQAILGAAKMVLDTGMHPGQLKDMVCSPGGTTIQAVATLEEKGFRTALMSAMKTCADKSRELSKE